MTNAWTEPQTQLGRVARLTDVRTGLEPVPSYWYDEAAADGARLLAPERRAAAVARRARALYRRAQREAAARGES